MRIRHRAATLALEADVVVNGVPEHSGQATNTNSIDLDLLPQMRTGIARCEHPEQTVMAIEFQRTASDGAAFQLSSPHTGTNSLDDQAACEFSESLR
jgi:hypothetical protein